MATGFEWTKLILDKWTVILPIILFLCSSVGWSFSAVDNSDKDTEIQAVYKNIETIKQHYTKKPQKCPDCGLKDHIKNHH